MANYKIAIIVGSLRKDSINRRIARTMCALRGDNLECQMVEIGDLPLYNQDYDLQRQQPEPYVRFREQVAAADGILFCTPEYNRGVPTGGVCGTGSRRRSLALHQVRSAGSAPANSCARPACSSICR